MPSTATTRKKKSTTAKKPAAPKRKVFRLSEKETNGFSKITILVHHRKKGKDRYAYGFDPGQSLNDRLAEYNYDGDVKDFVIVEEPLTEDKYREEVDTLG